jgi:hypothetical protein
MSMFDWLDIAPRSEQGTERACWTAFLASTIQQLAATNDPLLLASAVLSLQDWPAQTTVASALADRLAAAVPVRPDGTLVLPAHLSNDRAARSTVMTALVVGEKLGSSRASQASVGTLWSRLLVERDASGGYGSAEATRLVLRALLDAEPASPAPAFVRWTELSNQGRPTARGEVNLGANGSATLPHCRSPRPQPACASKRRRPRCSRARNDRSSARSLDPWIPAKARCTSICPYQSRPRPKVRLFCK